MRNVEGLEEHRDMLAKVGKLLYFSMSESKDLSVEVTGKRAKVSRTLQVATNRSVLETRVWKIVDGYWKLVSVCIEDI